MPRLTTKNSSHPAPRKWALFLLAALFPINLFSLESNPTGSRGVLLADYSISATGPTTFCIGDSVLLWVTDTAASYQWFAGNVEVPGANTFEYWADATADYHVTFFAEGVLQVLDPLTVTVNALPDVQIGSYNTIWDTNDPSFFIAGSPVGGTFEGIGISGFIYDPALPGVGFDTVVYTYTDGNLCTNNDTIIFEIRDYDFKAGARYLADIDSWCSPDGFYTTSGATPDENSAGCWTSGPNNNRWFSFQATTDQVHLEVKSGGPEGDNRNPEVALWDINGTELACQRYWDSNYDDISIGYIGLIPGDWYFISVDNLSGSAGRFSLCVDDQVDYDFIEGAKVIPHTSHWRSAEAGYSTRNATPDRLKGDCWDSDVNSNRWFTFTALAPTIAVDLLIGGLEGSMRYPYAALWNEEGVLVACSGFSSEYGDIRIGTDTLTVGSQYYISVDHYDEDNYDGTFTLALDDQVDYDFKAGAIEIPHTNNWRSTDAEFTTINATPDGIKGSCWITGPANTRWFKFRASSVGVSAELFTGGNEGTLSNGFMVLTDSVGAELACARYYSTYSDIKLGYDGLLPGQWYYLIVDNHSGQASFNGTFTLGLDNEVDYDFKSGAYDINDPSNWCSALAEFTTLNASPDGNAGGCWPNGPTFNRWFKFTATSTQVMAQLKTGGDEGSLRFGLMALFDDTGTELACGSFSSQYADVNMGYAMLTPGETYYITVDNFYTDNPDFRGTFTLCVNDQADYDYPEGAELLTDLNNWCSPEAAYTTIDATGGSLAGSCWNTGPNFDRWFKFQATTNEVLIQVLTGGAEGTLRNGYVAIWDDSFNELACNRYTSEYSDLAVGATSLTPGDWYYISVDNEYTSNPGYRGTFSLCITDAVDDDFRTGAYEIPDIDGWCSTDKQFTTEGATPDMVKGSCWPNGPNFNRWFRFQATGSNVLLNVLTGGDQGTLKYPLAVLYDTLGNEMACATYFSEYSDLSLASTSLTPGEWYYLSVDNYNNEGNRGSFTLCVDDMVDYDFPEGAHVVTDIVNYCSAEAEFTTLGASADHMQPACWPNGPNYNRWFQFQATATGEVNIQVKTGGSEGTMSYPMVALWDTTLTELACRQWVSQYGDIEIGYSGLVPGEWYFFSVDNPVSPADRGTFTVCMGDEISYDFFAGAVELNDLNGWCSDEAIYATVSATPDEGMGSCWPNGPNNNRWFRFRATSSIIAVQLRTGGIEGSVQKPNIALWDTLKNELACEQWITNAGDVEVYAGGLTLGEWYYISVDNASDGIPGTFSLCVTDHAENDLLSDAVTIAQLNNWCSGPAQWSNVLATADESQGSCWTGVENKNVWFRFRATSGQSVVKVTTGGDYGQMVNQQVSIWDGSGTEIACAGPLSGQGELMVMPMGMTIGDWYYISVDDDGTSGTFTLCVDDTLDYDYPQGAFEITNPVSWCSPEGGFSNDSAAADITGGSCWDGSNFRNAWFTFVAPGTDINIRVKSGTTYGSMERPQVALFDGNMNEVACAGPDLLDGIRTLQSDTLTPGQRYYFAVDNGEANGGNTGSFSICIADVLDYDLRKGALELPHDYGCSSDAAFSNIQATDDGGVGSCWGSSNSNANIWFKFQATSPYANVQLKTGNIFGTMRRAQMAIFNEAEVEVACIGDILGLGTTQLEIDTLTAGNWYWISVDDNQTSGTFSLCLEDRPDYDYVQGAIEVPHNLGCSADAEFSNFQATADELPGSCWGSYNELNNVWFRFQATTPFVTVQLKTGTVYGNMQRAQMALWDAGLNEVSCVGDIMGQGITEMVFESLNIGEWYYISVDDNYASGSFSLCLDDELTFDYLAEAVEIPHNMGCSEDAVYTNLYATEDEIPGSCWGAYNGTKNVWFKFQALSSYLTFELKTGNVKGSMERGQLVLFNMAGQEVSCIGDIVGQGTTTLSADTLNPGDWYFIAVDDDYTSGSFSFCIADQPSFNFWEGALELPHNFGCSPDAAYTNLAADSDMLPGSCWGAYNSTKNVWFKFQATTSNVTVELKTGSVNGNMQRGQMALWNDLFTEIACVGDIVVQGTTNMSVDSLTVGNWYYISVDDNFASGSFSLCLWDKTTYDYFESALELQHDGGCSADEAYSNLLATADRSMASCWSGLDPDDNKNIWFKFQALTTDVTLTLRNYNIYGDMRYPQAALWNASGVELKCLPKALNRGTSTLSFNNLTIGEWYYISVDDDDTPGTFTLCIEDAPDYDFKSGAYEIVSPARWCSADAQFSNYFATPDEMPGSCWTGGESRNVWFRFTAVSGSVNVVVRNGTILGTLQDLQAALWNENGDEVACTNTEGNSTDISLLTDTLTIGNTYYISVDDSQDPGSFSICVDSYPLNAELVGTNVTCNGADDGTATVFPEGGTGAGFSYSWLRNGVPIVGNTSVVTGLDPATYQVTVTDVGNPLSTVDLSYTVTEDPELTLSLTKTDDDCPGDYNGIVVATPGGGSGIDYAYTWFRNDMAVADITSSLLGVDSAEYKVVVTDAGAPTCTITDSVVVINNNAESVAPTGITIINDDTCPGALKTLTVTGGSLGDAAIWNWHIDPGFTSSSGIGTSIEVDPAVNTTYYVRAEGLCNITLPMDQLVTVKVASSNPTGIDVVNDQTCQGTSKILSVVGGSLGDGADWYWYADAAYTILVDIGNSISVDPVVNTTYYVRAQGDCNISAAVSRLITVSVPSTNPTGISITNDNTCVGITKTLIVQGGSLGDGADWFWYSDAGYTSVVDQGDTLTIDPVVNTTYYVRAEGECNNTSSVSQLINVQLPSTDPTAILVVNNNTCFGTTKSLTVEGGNLGEGADWYWYYDATFTDNAGAGDTIYVDPASDTTYYVRAEGICNMSNPANTLVIVNIPSVAPTDISVSNDFTCPGTSKTLAVVGGSLSNGANWQWYSDTALTISEGTGASIVVGPSVNTTFYVRAEGGCNTTVEISKVVSVKAVSVAPDMASADTTDFCFGTVSTITLSYGGGAFGAGADAYWYTDPLFMDDAIGNGNDLLLPAPADTTIYYLRFEGECNITEAMDVPVFVNPLPVISVVGEMTVCEPAMVDYTASVLDGSLVTWNVTGGTIMGDSTGTTITVEWTDPGTGTMLVTETTTGGCMATVDTTVVKHKAPSATEILGSNILTCAGDTGLSYYLEGMDNSSFTWVIEGGDMVRDFGDSVIVHWTVAPGEYGLSVQEISEDGCEGTSLSRTVRVDGPELEMGDDTYVCEGDSHMVIPEGTFHSYLWHDGSTAETFTSSEEGWITLIVADEFGCTMADSLYLTVQMLPMVDLGEDTSLCGDMGLVLDAGPDGTIFNWSTGENNQTIMLFQGARREVWVEVEDEFGCISMDTIVVDECNPEFYFMDIPTAITPNNDGTNDFWIIHKLQSYTRAEVEIFNRWGTLTWKSEPGYSVPWDGRDMHGREVPMDSYHFVIKLNTGSVDRITGIVTVIR